MNHIVIGCDATGKTTLANKISKKLGIPIKHMVQPKTDDEGSAMFYAYQLALMESNNVIFDRSFYCEMVYGPIFRGKSWISQEQARMLEEIMVSKGAMLYYCYDDPEAIIERFKVTGESFVGPEHVRSIIEGYERELHQVNRRIPLIYKKFGGKE